MRKIDLFYGVIIGLITSFVGVFLFVSLFTDYDFQTAIQATKAEGKLGKLITVGAILNLVVFFLLLKMNKELMARGVVLAMILLTIVTILV
ncbi:putative membrane protein [Flavobacterium arsenatis]|uniref:Membrane protein n=1 Tax=Flavobacterium arsenatis TaxID=1484332 RepID=A0ABU1TK87_9FLAO|nr:hypothetical protein [Flavobacterium arsenatis]MDR6966388.1 putative membrane protein [Flavobacterium arsenatis]